jgi:hypothetical protein
VTGDDGMAQWQLAELAGKVGALLGMPLDLTWKGCGVRIGIEGNGLYVQEPYNRRGRISITGWFPVTSHGFDKGERAAITVRADRGPRAIAAEINSRLMPGYRAAMVKVRECDAAERAARQARATLTAYITGLFPAGRAVMPAHCQSDNRNEIILYLPGHAGGSVRFHGDGREVEFDRFRVPAAVALRMLEISALLVSADQQEEASCRS